MSNIAIRLFPQRGKTMKITAGYIIARNLGFTENQIFDMARQITRSWGNLYVSEFAVEIAARVLVDERLGRKRKYQ